MSDEVFRVTRSNAVKVAEGLAHLRDNYAEVQRWAKRYPVFLTIGDFTFVLEYWREGGQRVSDLIVRLEEGLWSLP